MPVAKLKNQRVAELVQMTVDLEQRLIQEGEKYRVLENRLNEVLAENDSLQKDLARVRGLKESFSRQLVDSIEELRGVRMDLVQTRDELKRARAALSERDSDIEWNDGMQTGLKAALKMVLDKLVDGET